MKNRLFQGLVLATFTCFSSSSLLAQGVHLSASTQELGVFGRIYNGVKGSQYLNENWSVGKVQLTDGTMYEGLMLKYDQLNDVVIFKNENNTPQTFTQPVREFTLHQVIDGNLTLEKKFRNGYLDIDEATGNSYYEVLSDGKTQLLKRTSKAIVEERGPNERVPSRWFKAQERYYLLTDGKLQKVKKDKKSFLTALNANSSKLDQYLKSKKVNFKSEEDLAALISFYNKI